MPLNRLAIIEQLDSASAHARELIHGTFEDLSNLSDNKASEAVVVLASAIERLAPPGSVYLRNSNNCQIFQGPGNTFRSINCLLGVVKALRMAYLNNYLQSIQELLHADMFSDFLEMSEHLLQQNYKDPAAVLTGSVLEQHLRSLAMKNGVSPFKADGEPKKADALNADLVTQSIYSKLDLKSVTAWLDLRNKAAHGNYDLYTKEQVALQLQGVRDFMARNPA